jgi:NADPH:quinone reductase-like Zn-dependent oxidoreductase
MRAVRIYRSGGPEELKPEEVPVPKVGPGELLVRVEAIGVPYYEIQLRAGVFPAPDAWPEVFGHEAAGTVVEAEDAAMVGRRVVAMSMTGGAYAEYLVAPESAAMEVPDGVSAMDAVAVAVPAAVALALLRTAKLTGKETVLVEAAAGGVGGYLTQLARAQGAARVFATAGGAKGEQVKDVDAVFDHRASDWVDQVPEGLDVVFESIGGASANKLLDKLVPGSGRMLFYGLLSGEPPAVTPLDLLMRGLTLIGCGGQAGFAKLVEVARADVLEELAAGRLKPSVDSTFSLAEAANAHERVESGEAVGRVILLP